MQERARKLRSWFEIMMANKEDLAKIISLEVVWRHTHTHTHTHTRTLGIAHDDVINCHNKMASWCTLDPDPFF